MGNQGAPDGERFKGRGFVQLTGRSHYTDYGPHVQQDLVNDPDLANHPKIAADLLALFLKDNETKIRKSLTNQDLAHAHRDVNGGSHGLDVFTEAYDIGNRLF